MTEQPEQHTDDVQETDTEVEIANPTLEQSDTEGTDTPDAQDEAEDTRKKGSHEAAKYRRQLRDTEAERDQLAKTVQTARNIILNNHLQSQQISLKTAGIQKLGYDITELINDDLTINETALNTTLQDIADNGFTYQTPQGIVKKSGTGSGDQTDTLTWKNAIKRDHD